MEVWVETEKPKVVSAVSIALAVALHVVFFAVFAILANIRFKPKESVIPIDLTIVVNENLDGKENEPPPLDDPPEPPPEPEPQRQPVTPPAPPPPPPVVDTKVDAVVKEREKPKPVKTRKELEEDRMRRMREAAKLKEDKLRNTPVKKQPEKKPPKKTREQLMKERLERMRNSAAVKKVDIKVPGRPSGDGRTARRTQSAAEIQRMLNQGYKPGTDNRLAADEAQRCVSLIQSAYLSKWERPPWTSSLKEAHLRVKFTSGGKVTSWTLVKSSGDAAADRTVRRAASMVTEVYGLSESFISKNRAGVIVRFKVTP